MIRRGSIVTAVATAVTLGIGLNACARQSVAPADTIFGGRFLTLAPEHPTAAAIAVRDGRILAIGGEADVAGYAGPSTRRIAVPGVALPGLADAHVHALGLGEQLDMLDLRGLQKAAILSLVEALARQTPPGEWI